VKKVEPIGQHDCMVTKLGLSGNEAGAASEAFARWLHHQQGYIELSSAGVSYYFTA